MCVCIYIHVYVSLYIYIYIWGIQIQAYDMVTMEVSSVFSLSKVAIKQIPGQIGWD